MNIHIDDVRKELARQFRKQKRLMDKEQKAARITQAKADLLDEIFKILDEGENCECLTLMDRYLAIK